MEARLGEASILSEPLHQAAMRGPYDANAQKEYDQSEDDQERHGLS
jgi:hypothetical protein